MKHKLILMITALSLIATACGSSDTTEDTWAIDDAQRSTTTWATGIVDEPKTATTEAAAVTEERMEEEAYDGVTFTEERQAPAVDAGRDRLSTFAMDVDTGSYNIARRFLADGRLPDPASVRPEEFINALDYHYPGPDDGFAIHLMGGETPFTDRDTVLLQVGLQAVRVEAEDRPPANLTFVIDVSGSMDREDRLETVKDTLEILVSELRPSDQVAIVTYGTQARVELRPTSIEESDEILDVIRALRTNGSTNAEAGLRLGYDLADEAFSSRAINRVILASDGVANVGVTSAEGILESVGDWARRDIQLVTVGFGMGNYNDTFMEQLADQGDGFYGYVDTLEEAYDLFAEQLTGTLYTVALDAKVQVEFNPQAVDEYRLIGYENRAIADEDFRNDSVDAGEVGAGHSVTALYEVLLTRDARSSDELADVQIRWIDPDSNRAVEAGERIDVGDLVRSFDDAPRSFQLATTVGAFAEVLRDARYGDDTSLDELSELADELAREFDDEKLDDFADMVYDASRLAR